MKVNRLLLPVDPVRLVRDGLGGAGVVVDLHHEQRTWLDPQPDAVWIVVAG